jgi:hypothetical protein
MTTVPPSPPSISRRGFLLLPAGLILLRAAEAFAAPLAVASARSTRRPTVKHPDPRPGITAARVLPADRFPDDEKAARLYDMAREIPEVLDGLYCHCDCDGPPMNHRSLLSCFESDQAAGCYACGAEARLAYRLHREGKDLAEIRRRVDQRFG